MNRPRSTLIGSTRQRGAISIMTALLLMTLLLVMALVLDGGRLYLEKRNLQKIADMAALSAAARMPPGSCSDSSVRPDVFLAAEKNGFPGISADWNLETTCSNRRIEVIATHHAPTSLLLSAFLNRTTEIKASASAEHGEPIAAFSVGSQFLSLKENSFLFKTIRSIGIDVSQLSILDSRGFANTTITLGGLLSNILEIQEAEISLLTPSEVLSLIDAKVGALGVNEIINASIELLEDNTLHTPLYLFGSQIISNPVLNNLDLNLISQDEEGLIRLEIGGRSIGRPALSAAINLSDLIATSILSGFQGSSLNLNLDLLNLGQNNNLAGVELKVIEPPTIAIGPEKTTATSTQLQLSINLASLPHIQLLDIRISIAQGKAELSQINCPTSPAQPTASFFVSSEPVTACLGLPSSNCNSQGGSILSAPLTLQAGQSETVGSALGLNLSSLLRNTVRNLPLLGQVLALLGLDRVVGAILLPVDLVLKSVLEALGLEIGKVDVGVISISCGVPELVE